jgi:hypothetical protein
MHVQTHQHVFHLNVKLEYDLWSTVETRSQTVYSPENNTRTFTKYYQAYRMKDEMGGTCSTRGSGKEC